jgi:hypothetical protein
MPLSSAIAGIAIWIGVAGCALLAVGAALGVVACVLYYGLGW